jgi:hypothetical protein
MIINNIAIQTSWLLEKNGKFAFGYPELWKFGDYKHFTSLKLMYASARNSFKGDIDGNQVGHVFVCRKNIDKYCNVCEGYNSCGTDFFAFT